MTSTSQRAAVLGLVACITALPMEAGAAGHGRRPTRVTVVNPASDPVLVKDVDAAATREPFQAQINFTIPVGFVVNGDGVLVPAGKRFVIEYASLYVRDFPSRTVVRAWVEASVGGNEVRHFFVPTRTGLDSGPAAVTVAGQSLQLYAEGGTFAGITVEISSAVEGSATVEASLSGYLVDAP